MNKFKFRKIILNVILFLAMFTVLAGGKTYYCQAKTAKPATYGYDDTNKWSYHILNSKKKTVELRPAKLCKTIKGVNSGAVKIPETIKIGKKKYKVVAIGKSAYSVCTCLDCNILLQKLNKRWTDVTKYGKDNLDKNTFNRVTSVTIPKSVTNIKDYAFTGQNRLKKITFKDNSNLTQIGKYALESTKISAVSLPKKLQTLKEGAFKNCESLQTVTFNGTALKSIGKKAFRGTNVKKINVNTYQMFSKIKKLMSDSNALKNAVINSKQTLVHIKLNGTTENIYVNKGTTINYANKISFDTGKVQNTASISYIEKLTDSKNTNGISELTTNKYKANGKPEVYITVTDRDIMYTINSDFTFISRSLAHFGCELELGENQYCYCNYLIFGAVPTDESYQKEGYEIVGYVINGRVYVPGEVAYGLSDTDGATLNCTLKYKKKHIEDEEITEEETEEEEEDIRVPDEEIDDYEEESNLSLE